MGPVSLTIVAFVGIDMGDDVKTNYSSLEFLDRLRSKDEKAVTEIVHAYSKHLYRAAVGLGLNEDHAKELVQRVWVTFFDVVQEFRGQSHIRTFVFGILYNKASEMKRENLRFDTKEPIEDILDERFDEKGSWTKAPVDPEQFMLASETRSIIEKCLEALPLAQKMAFVLREVEGEETSEICKILNVSITNLGVLFFRAKNGLRECIEGKSHKT